MPALELPAPLVEIVRAFRTCEFSTLAKDGTPITWPTLPFFDEAAGQFLITTSIALPQKVYNVRRDGRVALLFSEPRASGLARPGAVLVQGDATAPDEIVTSIAGAEAALAEVFRRQPGSAIYSSNPLMRHMADWYYMRLIIQIVPRRISWWPAGDFSRAPEVFDLAAPPDAPPAKAFPAPAGQIGEGWATLLRELASYETAVLAGRDAHGYPWSARVRPQPDARERVLRVVPPPGAPLVPGPAGLLCHRHDDLLWKQESSGARGALERDARGWLFRPAQLIPGISPDAASLARFFLSCRRNANAYLARRKLTRPSVPWNDIIAVKRQALGK